MGRDLVPMLTVGRNGNFNAFEGPRIRMYLSHFSYIGKERGHSDKIKMKP